MRPACHLNDGIERLRDLDCGPSVEEGRNDLNRAWVLSER